MCLLTRSQVPSLQLVPGLSSVGVGSALTVRHTKTNPGHVWEEEKIYLGVNLTAELTQQQQVEVIYFNCHPRILIRLTINPEHRCLQSPGLENWRHYRFDHELCLSRTFHLIVDLAAGIVGRICVSRRVNNGATCNLPLWAFMAAPEKKLWDCPNPTKNCCLSRLTLEKLRPCILECHFFTNPILNALQGPKFNICIYIYMRTFTE